MSLDDDQKNFGNAEIPAGWLDLRLGNPLFLKGFWDNAEELNEYRKKMGTGYVWKSPSVPVNSRMQYPSQDMSSILIYDLTRLHERHKNLIISSEDGSTDHFIAGNGANHLLMVTMLSMKDMGAKYVYAPAPYWPRFKNLAGISGLKFYDLETPPSFERGNDDCIFLYTTPNNPDAAHYGKQISAISDKKFVIADLNYNWPLYTDNVFPSEAPVSIFGLSKMTGHASTRFGWAYVKDKALADKMKHYVELTTSGVSADITNKTQNIINYIHDTENSRTSQRVFEYGRIVLQKRWNMLCGRLMFFNFEFEENGGMFLYGIDHDSIFEKAKIMTVQGSAFGVGQEKYIRVNIGCDDRDFEELIRRLDEIRQSIDNKDDQ